MRDTCGDCQHCDDSCYCDVVRRTVNPDSRACPEFEER